VNTSTTNMYSTSKLALVFLYCLAVIYGFGYVIFFQGASGWWWLLAITFSPSPNLIYELARTREVEHDEPDEAN